MCDCYRIGLGGPHARGGRVTVLALGVFLSATGAAEDSVTRDTPIQPAPTVTISDSDSLHELRYAARWRLADPVEALATVDNAPPLLADLEFQNSSPMSRVSKLRSLSLLTIAETEGTRLFLGVNDDGLAGLHFSVHPKRGDERYLEFARMPYLAEDDLDDDSEDNGDSSGSSGAHSSLVLHNVQ